MSNSGDLYPHWLGLLKWSLAQTDPEGSGSDFTEMSQENKEFLEAVMKDLVKDEPGDLQKILIMFQEIIDRGIVIDDNSHILDLLEDAQLIVDQIDMANVFIKFGGAAVLKNILSSNVLLDDCKCTAAVICGELSQNNPTAQAEMISSGLLDQLAVVAASPSTAPRLCAKSTYGISCIIRGSRDGEQRFCEIISGPTLLRRLMERQDTQCAKRVMFLANALIMSDYSTAERTSKVLLEVAQQALPYINCSDLDVRETAFRLLSTSLSTRAGVEIVEPFLRETQETLEIRQKTLTENGDEDSAYEIKQIEEILQKMRTRGDLPNSSDNDTTHQDNSQNISCPPLLVDKT